ncbi:3',5'-cyclic-nucleotide phosphodiesterase [Aureococcus anophagefferens]|nr:3',5'-cyclic-nucleotide phosphodiesterase [Aureococcus anophagefferens]
MEAKGERYEGAPGHKGSALGAKGAKQYKDYDADDKETVSDAPAALAKTEPPGGIGVAATPEAKRVGFGFAINWMNMRDAYSGRILWEQKQGWADMYEREILARVPWSILSCRAVSREVNFSSEQKMEHFRLEQRPPPRPALRGLELPVRLRHARLHELVAAGHRGADEMMPAEVLNGNVVIETSFFDGDMLIAKCRVRIFYDARARRAAAAAGPALGFKVPGALGPRGARSRILGMGPFGPRSQS